MKVSNMKIKSFLLIAACTLMSGLLLTPAIAADIEAGKTKSAMCAACHAADGNGLDPSYPKLAGQHASYLAQSLQDYKSGKRKNPIMSGMAAGLTDTDIEDLSAYYASMDGLKDLGK